MRDWWEPTREIYEFIKDYIDLRLKAYEREEESAVVNKDLKSHRMCYIFTCESSRLGESLGACRGLRFAALLFL